MDQYGRFHTESEGGRALKNRCARRGQGMSEYIIIVALVSIATLGIITLFGDNVRKVFAASADALTGAQTVENEGQQASDAEKKKNLTNFAKDNYR